MNQTVILVLTRGYARYRENLFKAVAEALPPSYRLVHSTPHQGHELWEVDWNGMLANSGPVKHITFPRIGLRSFARALAEKLGYKPRSEAAGMTRIEDIAPDLVLIQEFSLPMLKAAVYCFLRGTPCVLCSDLGRDSDWRQFQKRTRLVHRWMAFLTDGVVAHTAAARIPTAGLRRPICYVPHSVDIRNLPEPVQRTEPGPVRVLMVAQYIPRKGHDLLAQAVRLLMDRGVADFELRLVGTQDPAWVAGVIEKEGIADRVQLLGMLKGDALFEEFRRADLFVLTSRFDTFAVVVHEAAAFGLPLLISKFAESSALMVAEGENGYVIDPFDTVDLAVRLEQLISQPELRREMGRRSRAIAESLCASKVGVKFANWLVELHSGTSSGKELPHHIS